jgi:hypothetical protein
MESPKQESALDKIKRIKAEREQARLAEEQAQQEQEQAEKQSVVLNLEQTESKIIELETQKQELETQLQQTNIAFENTMDDVRGAVSEAQDGQENILADMEKEDRDEVFGDDVEKLTLLDKEKEEIEAKIKEVESQLEELAVQKQELYAQTPEGQAEMKEKEEKESREQKKILAKELGEGRVDLDTISVSGREDVIYQGIETHGRDTVKDAMVVYRTDLFQSRFNSLDAKEEEIKKKEDALERTSPEAKQRAERAYQHIERAQQDLNRILKRLSEDQKKNKDRKEGEKWWEIYEDRKNGDGQFSLVLRKGELSSGGEVYGDNYYGDISLYNTLNNLDRKKLLDQLNGGAGVLDFSKVSDHFEKIAHKIDGMVEFFREAPSDDLAGLIDLVGNKEGDVNIQKEKEPEGDEVYDFFNKLDEENKPSWKNNYYKIDNPKTSKEQLIKQREQNNSERQALHEKIELSVEKDLLWVEAKKIEMDIQNEKARVADQIKEMGAYSADDLIKEKEDIERQKKYAESAVYEATSLGARMSEQLNKKVEFDGRFFEFEGMRQYAKEQREQRESNLSEKREALQKSKNELADKEKKPPILLGKEKHAREVVELKEQIRKLEQEVQELENKKDVPQDQIYPQLHSFFEKIGGSEYSRESEMKSFVEKHKDALAKGVTLNELLDMMKQDAEEKQNQQFPEEKQRILDSWNSVTEKQKEIAEKYKS